MIISFLIGVTVGLFLEHSIIGLIVVHQASNEGYHGKTLLKFFLFWEYAIWLALREDKERFDIIFPET